MKAPGTFTGRALGAIVLGSQLACAVAPAQAQLPAPGRTIYKCEMKGKVEYSDEPCIGAKRLDVVPTRGMNRLSGTTRTGTDVAREIHTEQMAQALRPLSGMSGSEYVTFSRRHRLSAESQRECRQLEPAILGLEQAEQRSRGTVMPLLQQELLVLRKRFKTLGC